MGFNFLVTTNKFAVLHELRQLCSNKGETEGQGSGGTRHSISVLKDLNGISKRKEALPSQGARALVEFLSVGCSEVSGTE